MTYRSLGSKFNVVPRLGLALIFFTPAYNLNSVQDILLILKSAAELNSHWQTTLKDLLADIVRNLHQDGSTSQDPESRKPRLGLIVYGSQGPCTETQALPWGWTYDVNIFLAWLSAVRFTGGEFSEAALRDGLHTALETIAADTNEVPISRKTHCILITSYKFIPSLQHMNEDQNLYSEEFLLRKLDRFLADATPVARKFAQSSVSLSIISPDQSPRLEDLFTAGGNFNCLAQLYNLRAQNYEDERGNSNYLVLLSQNFMEAYSVFINRDLKIKPANDNYKDGNVQTTGNNFTEVVPINQPQTDFHNKLSEIAVFLLGSDYDNDVIGPQENFLDCQYDLLTENYPAVEDMMKSLEDSMYQPLASPIKCHDWTALSKSHLGIGTSKDLMDSKKWERNSNIMNLSKNVRHLPWEYMVGDEHRLKRRCANVVGQSSKANTNGRGNTVDKSECGKSILASTITPYSCLSLLGVIPPGYAKAWEGDIMTVEEGGALVFSRLVIYRKNSASEMFFNNWPNRMYMEQLIPKIFFDEMQFFGEVEWLLVDAMLPRSTIDNIERENLCGYIRLPNQTLLLHPFVRGSRFVAALYNGVLDNPTYTNFRK